MGGSGGCSVCVANEVPAPPDFLTGSPTVLPGGIAGFIVIRGDVTFTDIQSQTEWEAKIAANTLRGRLNGCRISGSKGQSETTTKKRGACAAEEVTGRTQVWNITDLENDDDYSMHDFYEWIRANKTCLKIAFVTCDYRVYGFVPATSPAGTFMPISALDVDDEISETSDDDASIKMTVRTKQVGLIKPILVPFLETIAADLKG